LELELGGNHLLENLRALVLAGCLFDTPQSVRWLDLADRYLRREIPNQILEHGEHFEVSPAYHCQVLGGLLQMTLVLRFVRPQLSQFCQDASQRMYSFLVQILHPDGEIPLFGDSCFGESFPVAELHRLANAARLEGDSAATGRASTAGPYWVWRSENGKDALIFDAGQVAADCLPAHGHCDLLGFEASIEGERWIVDSGVYNYEEDTMRVYCRSSVAHNTVTINDRNQCDVWSRFRMGYRGRPGELRHGCQHGFSWASASHDAYLRLGAGSIERLLVASDSGTWFCVDRVEQRAQHSVVGRLHFAPGIEAEKISSTEYRLRNGSVHRILRFAGTENIDTTSGWYCKAFGVRQRTTVIAYRLATNTDTMSWSLAPADAHPTLSVVARNDCTAVVLRTQSEGPEYHWEFGAR
jgi:uncharacterized heparinase superfamily protein